MKINESKYLKFINYALELAKDIPKYFSKFSKKIFCNHQKITLLVLKQKLNTTYRDLVELLKMSDIPLYIGLKRIPHHTTLVKFAKRIKPKLLNLFLVHKKAKKVAVDATGLELEKKSYYYRKITQDRFNNRRKTKRFMKLTIAIDTDSQLIMNYNLRRDYKKCNEEFRKILSDLKIDYALADKGYDCKQNRLFVINKLKAIPIIPRKCHTNFYGYLKQGKKIDGKYYHQRSKAETAFSAIKKKYGSCLTARSFATQKIEAICKLIAYNVDRTISTNFYYFLRMSAEPITEKFKY